MSRITVFISYSHDSEAHRKRVLGLSERLRGDGIETILDQSLHSDLRSGVSRSLLGQSGVEPGALGPIKPRERAKERPLTFDVSPDGATSFKADISRIVKYAPVRCV